MALLAAEYDGLLPQDTELAQKTNVPDVFGATQDDTAGLRIVSLQEVSPLKPHLTYDAHFLTCKVSCCPVLHDTSVAKLGNVHLWMQTPFSCAPAHA